MRLWERLVRPPQRSSLSWDDYQDFFSFNGLQYPFLQTSMGQLNEESISRTASGAYHSNGIVFALVVARLQVFSQVRFQWTRFEGARPTDTFGDPELAVLERPWPGGTTSDLLGRMEVDASLAGNAYIRRVGRNRLSRMRPDWMTIMLGSNEDVEHPNEASDVTVAGYLYKPPSARMQVFLPEEVAHYAPLPDPDMHFLGMSWITPAMQDVQADSAQTAHKQAFLRNAATPNLAIKFDPSTSLKAVKEFKELLEAEHKGAFNAWKTLYLGGGADPKVIGKDFRELDFAVTQGKGESRLAADAGVPPSWVGFSEGLQGSALNAGNFTAARRRFADGTMQHLWQNVSASLEILLRRPDDGVSLWFDTSAAAFMREDAGERAKIQAEEADTITKFVRDGFTWQSAIDAVRNSDWTRLKHTGFLSVQLQEPGQVPPTPGTEPMEKLSNTNGASS